VIIHSIYDILAQCYKGEDTLEELKKLREEYPSLGSNMTVRMEKYSDVGRAYAKEMGLDTDYANKVIYHLADRNDYCHACIDYIAGMTDTYAEKVFDELTTF
jgi:dGTPase